MAAQRAICPRCGSLVGIPSLQRHHPGADAPLSPLERLRHARTREPIPRDPASLPPDSPPLPTEPVESNAVRLQSHKAPRKRGRSDERLEKHWAQCLLYPLRAWRFCLGLSVFLTILSGLTTAFFPTLLANPPTDSWGQILFYVACALWMVFLVGLPYSFLECVLVSASAGEVYYIIWSGNPFVLFLLSGMRWMLCFCSGPVIFAGMGLWYWLSCGDLTWFDGIILFELSLVAIVFQIFALLAVTDHGRLRAVNPLAVADLAHRLGWSGLAVVLGAAFWLMIHGRFLLKGLTDIHDEPARGVIILICVWLGGVFWSTFFCRLLGLWCYRTRKTIVALPTNAESQQA